ncbi:unnamed protein product, partial [Discosporangium mesarthrocarpum]
MRTGGGEGGRHLARFELQTGRCERLEYVCEGVCGSGVRRVGGQEPSLAYDRTNNLILGCVVLCPAPGHQKLFPGGILAGSKLWLRLWRNRGLVPAHAGAGPVTGWRWALREVGMEDPQRLDLANEGTAWGQGGLRAGPAAPGGEGGDRSTMEEGGLSEARGEARVRASLAGEHRGRDGSALSLFRMAIFVLAHLDRIAGHYLWGSELHGDLELGLVPDLEPGSGGRGERSGKGGGGTVSRESGSLRAHDGGLSVPFCYELDRSMFEHLVGLAGALSNVLAAQTWRGDGAKEPEGPTMIGGGGGEQGEGEVRPLGG